MAAKRNLYRLLVGKPGIKRPLGRPTRHKGIDNIRMNLGEVVCGDVEWIGLALVNWVLNLRVP
jgi:hypothetical protein